MPGAGCKLLSKLFLGLAYTHCPSPSFNISGNLERSMSLLGLILTVESFDIGSLGYTLTIAAFLFLIYLLYTTITSFLVTALYLASSSSRLYCLPSCISHSESMPAFPATLAKPLT